MNQREIDIKYGATEGDWLAVQLVAFWYDHEDEFECVDNSRLANKANEDEMTAYDDASRTGCCGAYDTEFGPSPEGRTYAYGFNYGH